jgi:predicted MFS family arabinose efflux permease
VVGTLAQSLGWRAALQVIGLAGLPVALLVVLTVPEGRRPKPSAETREPFTHALAAIARRPALVHLMIGYGLVAICASGETQWSPSFFMRSYGMTMAQVGVWSGLASGVAGVAGLLSGGLLASALVPRDPRWELRIPVITVAISLPLFALMLLSPTAWLAIVMQFFAKYVSAVGGGVALAAVQSFVEPHRRATAVSIILFLSSVLGLGLGPYLIGAISDLLAPSLGQESLRYAMLLTCVVIVWSLVHFVIAERRTLQDRLN